MGQPMKIAIDGTEGLFQKLTGTGSYVRQLLRYLIPGEMGRDIVVLSMRAVDGDTGVVPRDHLRLLRTPTYRTVWTQVRLPLHMITHRYGLVHLPDHKLPFWSPGKMVSTILDLAVFRFPGMFDMMHRQRLEWFTRDAARRAHRLLAISESTKRDLCSILRVTPERVDVTHLGVDPEVFNPQVAPYRHPSPYLLSVGALQPRKNFVLLIRAFKRACARYEQPVDLLIVGQRGWMWEPIEAEARKPPFADRVRFLGYVPDERIPSLYAGAMAFAFPSLYEGFGIPLLEAMACGIPVISSNASSMPEVVGEAGLMIDPADESLWAEKLLLLFRDAELRRTLARLGLEQSRIFTWQQTATRTMDVYRDVLGDVRGGGRG